MLARLVIGVVVVALLPAAANAQEIKVTLPGDRSCCSTPAEGRCSAWPSSRCDGRTSTASS